MDRGSTPAAISAVGLKKVYGKGDTVVEAVRGVDLEVAPGEVFGFLGPNGAGKSTTVRMLTTLMTLSAGTAHVGGVDVVADPHGARLKIGVALQEAGLDSRQTGRETLVLQARLFGMSKSEAGNRAQELLELVELTDAADRRVKGYSGGMKRRLDLASALVHRPQVLFLDEPTTGLDPASRITVWDEVRRINRGGTTVFLTTQYLEEADQLCDRLAIIDNGLVVREGTPGRAERRTQGSSRAVGRSDPRRRLSRRNRQGPRKGRGRSEGDPMTTTSTHRESAATAASARPQGALRESLVLGGRALREAMRSPDSLLPTMFIPLFFLVVNVGQAARIFPAEGTDFLFGQNYGAFQLPASLLLSASFGAAALYLVEDIEGGYFDKLRATPIARMALILGRLYAEFVKTLVVSIVMVVLAYLFGIRIASGWFGFLVLIVLSTLWAMVFSGFMQLIALEDPQCRGDPGREHDLLPTVVLDAELRSSGSTHPADGDCGDAESGHLCDGRCPLVDPSGFRRSVAGQGIRRSRCGDDCDDRAEHPHGECVRLMARTDGSAPSGDPTARALALLSLLQTHRRWRGSELAERLGVTERTVRRDVDRLRGLGYPVDADPGIDGGYTLAVGAQVPPLLLDDDEAVALVVGIRANALASIEGIEDTSVRLMAKLDRLLPDRVRRRVEALHTNVEVLAWSPDSEWIAASTLTTLAQGCRDREEVRFDYRRGDGEESRRLVQPAQLVSAGRRWYLVAWDVRRNDWRTFRVDRIEAPSLAGVRFESLSDSHRRCSVVCGAGFASHGDRTSGDGCRRRSPRCARSDDALVAR